MSRAKKPQQPADFVVADELRTWAARKHGAMYLPDVFLSEWQDKCKANGRTYPNCYQALQNYINWESPAGKYYKAEYWERQVRKARKMEREPARLSMPAVMVAGQYVINGKPSAEPPIIARSSKEAADAAIAAMRARMAFGYQR